MEGHDACRKIAILSSLMTGKYVKYQDIYTEGITKISAEDFRYAKELQTSIKLLGMSKDTKDGYEAMVAPFMISDDHPLHAVNGVFNAIFVHGNMLGDSMFYGRGAGKLPTASAVVSDVVDCARHLGKTIICIWDKEELSLKDYRDSSKEFFLRVKKEGWEKAKELFEIQQVVEIIDGEVGIVTKEMTERAFEEKAAKLPEMITRIRMEK